MKKALGRKKTMLDTVSLIFSEPGQQLSIVTDEYYSNLLNN